MDTCRKVLLSMLLLLSIMRGSASGAAEYCDSLVRQSIAAMADRKNYAACIEMLQKANAIAAKKDLHQQHFLAQNNLGIIYYNAFDYGEALNYFLEAYTIATGRLTDRETMSVLNNIAILYSKEKTIRRQKNISCRSSRWPKSTMTRIGPECTP